jgi:hypothetical protein
MCIDQNKIEQFFFVFLYVWTRIKIEYLKFFCVFSLFINEIDNILWRNEAFLLSETDMIYDKVLSKTFF